MPLYESTCLVNLPAVEAVPIDVGSAYPFPRLEVRDGPTAPVEVRVIVLQNGFLRVGILPDFGGRLILPFEDRLELTIEPGGRRGARMVGGIEFSLDGRERLNAMGPVDVRLFEDDDEPAVLLGELSSGEGISWYMRVSLPLNRAAVKVEVKEFNRERLPCPYRAGFLAPEGVWVAGEPGVLIGSFRHAKVESLAPRQTDSWTCDLVPTSLRGTIGSSPSALASWDGSSLKIHPLADMPAHKVLLLSEGKSLETTADLAVGQVATFDLAGLPVEGVAIMGPEGTVFNWGLTGQAAATYGEAVRIGDLAGYHRALTRADNRGAAFVGLALVASRSGDYENAASFLDDALGVNAEDAVAWWLKAAMLRHLGQQNENELLNAHFLAPFEPLLRAESYLASPSQEKAPSTLIQPMMQDPDAVIEVAANLHEAGLMNDLSKWVDECLRHREIPMLRYFLADALLNNSRMRTEAAGHVMAVAQTPINPPYPWRRVELEVLSRLAVAFPDDGRLAELRRGTLNVARSVVQ